MEEEDLIKRIYALFNQRDIEGVLQYFHHDVVWPNGWEGGYVYGHAAVRDYWTRQWKEIDPKVTPETFKQLADGRLLVSVSQLIKNMQGQTMADGQVTHVFTFKTGLIKKMVIEAS